MIPSCSAPSPRSCPPPALLPPPQPELPLPTDPKTSSRAQPGPTQHTAAAHGPLQVSCLSWADKESDHCRISIN